jgi:hypothetical protein
MTYWAFPLMSPIGIVCFWAWLTKASAHSAGLGLFPNKTLISNESNKKMQKIQAIQALDR